MPELPDVEAYRRHVAHTCLKKEIRKVGVRDGRVLGCSPTTLRRALKGNFFTKTMRHGKNMFLELTKEDVLVLHFGMSGEPVHVGEKEEDPKHTRILFGFGAGDSLAYVSQRMLGKVDIADSKESYIQGKGLGPDALNVTEEEFNKAFEDARGLVKARLMDQKRLSGIGNIYADEILYQARIHPRRGFGDLSEKEFRRVHKKTREVLGEAVKAGGDPEKMPKKFITPKRGKSDALKKLKINGRTTYYNPKRQN